MADSPPDRQRILADAARMQAIGSGDARSFEVLIVEESARLMSLGSSLLSSPAEAEEVLQDAFLRLWQQAPSWEPRARISTWLHRVVYRLCIDRLRQRRPMLDISQIEDSLAGEDSSPEDVLWENQRDTLIDRALGRLPPRQRAAIVLAHRHGLSQSEAAATLELSEDAYESLLARGRRRLRELVAAAGQDRG